MGYRETIRRAQRRYMWQVVLWLLLVVPGGGWLISFVAKSYTSTPTQWVVAVVAVVVLLAAVGGALVIHRANMRCPVCGRWLLPVGVNGFAPTTCPRCKADLRS